MTDDCKLKRLPEVRSYPWWRRALHRIVCWHAWEDGFWFRIFWYIGLAFHRIDEQHRAPLFSERYGYGTFLIWRGKWKIQPVNNKPGRAP